MAEDVTRSADRPEDAPANGRLDSWKEIAAYLKRDVTTVRRWEKREGLPIHRHLHERRESVYAYTGEIDQWWQGRRNHLAQNGASEGATPALEVDAPIPPAVTEAAERLPRGARATLAWALAATFFVATLALTAVVAVLYPRMAPRDESALLFPIFPPDQTSFGTVVLSPDGRQLAFTASTRDGNPLLWIRPLDSSEARSLPDTDGATFPFWSPHSNALGFFAGGKLWTVDLTGGNPRAVCDAPSGRGGTWSRDGVIVFSPGREDELFRVQASGGAVTPVTTVDRPAERGHLWPEFLPDGNHFLYLADSAAPEPHGLFVGALDSPERKRLFNLAVSNATYVHDGYLIFAHERKLVAQPFDADRLVLTGERVTLVDQIFQQWDHKTDFSTSNNGTFVYRSIRGVETQLVWRDRADQETALVTAPAAYYEPTLSPDQTRVAVDIFDLRPSRRFGFNVAGVTSDIWILDAAKGTRSQFTSHPSADFNPLWSADGRSIVFSSNRSGVLDLYQKRVDGTDDEELVFASKLNKGAAAWSPDGRFLVYVSYEPETKQDLWLLPMVGDRTPTALLRDEFSQEQVQISPDGRWFAYTSNDNGRSEVYVQSFPTPGAKWQISTNGGGDARWRPDGRELFYIAEDRRLMAVSVKTGTTFDHGSPIPLFDTGMGPQWGEARNHYDVSRDGNRFLFMIPVADDRSSPFTIVLNWPAALRK